MEHFLFRFISQAHLAKSSYEGFGKENPEWCFLLLHLLLNTFKLIKSRPRLNALSVTQPLHRGRTDVLARTCAIEHSPRQHGH